MDRNLNSSVTHWTWCQTKGWSWERSSHNYVSLWIVPEIPFGSLSVPLFTSGGIFSLSAPGKHKNPGMRLMLSRALAKRAVQNPGVSRTFQASPDEFKMFRMEETWKKGRLKRGWCPGTAVEHPSCTRSSKFHCYSQVAPPNGRGENFQKLLVVSDLITLTPIPTFPSLGKQEWDVLDTGLTF